MVIAIAPTAPAALHRPRRRRPLGIPPPPHLRVHRPGLEPPSSMPSADPNLPTAWTTFHVDGHPIVFAIYGLSVASPALDAFRMRGVAHWCTIRAGQRAALPM